jgi:hypothetical protein
MMTHDEETAIDKLNNAIYGNGRDGLIERTVRIEDGLTNLKESTEKATVESKEFRIVITKELDEIKGLIVTHNTDKSIHTFLGLTLKKDILIGSLLVFLVIHSLIPPNFSIWKVVEKIVSLL